MASRRIASAALIAFGAVVCLIAAGSPLTGFFLGTAPYTTERIATIPPLLVLLVFFLAGSLIAAIRGRRRTWPIGVGVALLLLALIESGKDPSIQATRGPAVSILTVGLLVISSGLFLIPRAGSIPASH